MILDLIKCEHNYFALLCPSGYCTVRKLIEKVEVIEDLEAKIIELNKENSNLESDFEQDIEEHIEKNRNQIELWNQRYL